MAVHRTRDINRFAVSSFVDRVSDRLPAGARVLDAGAGEGRYRGRFRGRRYVGVDLGIGDADWDYGGLDARCDLTRLPFGAASFDAVLSTQTLEHLREPWAFLGEAARVLRPGGRIFLTAPQTFRLHQEPHDYYRYTRHGLAHLLEAAGFVVESIEPQGGYFHFLGDALRPLHRRLFGSERSLTFRILAAPLGLVSKVVFTTLLPLLLYHLDFLDEKRTMTTGNEAVARRPAEGENP